MDGDVGGVDGFQGTLHRRRIGHVTLDDLAAERGQIPDLRRVPRQTADGVAPCNQCSGDMPPDKARRANDQNLVHLLPCPPYVAAGAVP